MKTTIDIPDALMLRCKKVISEQHVTFRRLVEEGLDRVMEERVCREPFKLRPVKFRGGGFRTGFDEASVRSLWTADRDFTRFPALKCRNPLTSRD